jgi:hypothetical protein
VKTRTATYVYCLVVAPKRPRPTRKGLPRTGPVRVLDLDRGLFLVVADAPLALYGEAAIKRGLSDLDWVSRAAVAHEAMVESFIEAPAVLPMKLFTMFNTDERALEHVRGDRPRIDGLVKRLMNHHEWGVRVALARTRAAAPARRAAGSPAEPGAAYLTRKKAQRDRAVELAEHARDTVAASYDRMAAAARAATRRSASELPAQGGPLLLDAAFLVPRTRSRTFRSLVIREARALSRRGYGLLLTGPWPPYTFMQD